MISRDERIALRHQVEDVLKKDYSLNPTAISSVTNVVLESWFKDLDGDGSHLSVDLVAGNIADLAQQYLQV